MPNYKIPTNVEVREHFGELLPPGAIIEHTPNSTILALSDGTLLWDKTNGYAKLVPEKPEQKKDRAQVLIYLYGVQGCGKTSFTNMLVDALEVNRHNYISFTDLRRSLDNKKDNSILVVSDLLNDMSYSRILENYAAKRGLKFYNINLKRE